MMMKRTSSQSQQQNELPTFDDYVSGKIRDKARSEHELSEHLKSANYAQVEPVRAPQPPVATPRTLHVVDTASAAAVIDVPQASAVKEDEKERINALGDLIGLDEDDLALIAEDQGLSFEAVLKRQRVQQLLNKTRSKGEA
jgi:hypothetical protein